MLELTITIAILTSLALGVTLLLVPIARQTRLGRETQAANAAAKRVLEKIQALPFQQIVSTYPQASHQAIPGLPSGEMIIHYEDPAADPLVIQTTLVWQSPEIGSMQRVFHTVRTE